ncbi:MAG: FecR domain-containing protein [Cyanobacteria bacterium P01_F01_bin.116]
MRKAAARWCSFFLGASFVISIPSAVFAQTSLNWAKVEALRNRVHLIPNGRNARLARVADVMSIGDALRTASSARAELRFNDGSLARVGEQATFRFTPNTRNFQLSNGTVLLLIPPGRGRTTIQTPNAVTGIQGSALFVRVRCLAELTAEGYCSSPVTFVGALTNNPAGAMLAYNQAGSQQQHIHAGEMVVIEGDTITQRFEFDLRTFYETSGLAEGLGLDSATPPVELSEELQEVWQEIQDALELQGDFDSEGPIEEVVENPTFIAPSSRIANGINDSEGNDTTDVFAVFPDFQSSPAATFHSLSGSVVAASTDNQVIGVVTPEGLDRDTSVSSPVTDATIRAARIGITAAPAPVSITPDTGSAPVANTLPPSSSVSAPSTPAAVPTVEAITATPVAQPLTPVVTVPTPVEQQPATPVVTAPSPVADQPVTSVVTTPNPIEKPDVPVVTTPNPVVDTPTVATTTVPEDLAPTNLAPTLEADQIPERQTAPREEFDWQQSPGTNDPEVLQTTELTIGNPNAESAPPPTGN